MNILKSVLACVAVATFSLTAMATTPKGDVKDAKTTETVAAPSEVKADAKASFTYYVIARDNDNGTYDLSLSAPSGCGVNGPDPCQITTTTEHSDLEIPQDDVDNQNGVSIDSKRTL